MAVTIASTMANGTTGTLSAAGIGSGLDVNGLVTSLMAVENRALTALDTRQTAFQTKISAYGTVKSALAQFQTALAALEKTSTFGALTAQSSDASAVTATVAGNAVAGAYNVQVTQLAQSAKLVSDGFAATTDVVGSGTLTFQFGTFAAGTFTASGSAAKTVTIDPANGTLAGIRDAVNAANIGVTATIVNDGSVNGNRLVFTGTASGAANSLKLTVADGDAANTDNAGLSRLAFDPAAAIGSGRNLTQKVAAQDAKLVIDGIDVSKPSNTITDAIEGVTLNLLALTTGVGPKVSVAADASGVTKAVQGFVAAYNALNTTLRGLTKYDATTKQGATLNGDGTVRMIQSRIDGILGNPVAGLTAGTTVLDRLSQVGITRGTDGGLALDATKLATAASGSSGSAAIAALFAAVGKASDSLVGVTATGSTARAGTYTLNVTQLATRGASAGSAAAGLTITAGVNDQLDVTVDGHTTTVMLGAGTYASADALAAEVQSRINGASAISGSGSAVVVAAAAGVLTATSTRYGSASGVVFAGTAATSLLGGAPVTTTGVDVAGTLDGVAATGAGQVLRGATGSATDGLALTIAGGALGARGTITYSQGYAAALDVALKGFLAADGVVATRTDGLNRSITDLDHQRTTVQRHLAVVEANYRAQFTALDTMLGSMSTTSSYLQQQLANLPKITNG